MRIIVGLHAGAERDAVATTLRELGARDVQPAPPSLPDVLYADFPDGDPAGPVERVNAVPDVRYAEPDTMQSAF